MSPGSFRNFRIADRPDVDRATLVVLTDRLEPDQVREFQEACLKLLETGRKKLVVNLRGVRIIPSVIVGAVMDAYVLAKGRELVLDADVDATRKFMRLVPKILAGQQQQQQQQEQPQRQPPPHEDPAEEREGEGQPPR